ncbi:MAG: beta-lactamase family protein [Stigonema ocellatum SAG 48.90 = DSM 106950]|nr:beta-lactamase family protein [Stigonema ocellatum SAG 48.90 = DSM 106950]
MSVEQRIERVIQNLLPLTAFEGKLGTPKPLSERLEQCHTPGASIAVINNFEIEWARGFGVIETETTFKVKPTTLFQAASISKPIFALAVMRLVQEGRLDLDEDVNNYLTSWRVPKNGDWQPRITLRQLLSHSAGLTVHGFLGYQISEPLPSVVQILNGEPPANSPKIEVNILPGLQYRYSGGGTIVAQQLLVDVLGKPFPEIMHELVLQPLEMNNSTYEQPLPSDWAASSATAHPWKGIPLLGRHHVYPEMAAAGLWTTATDLALAGVELLKVLNGKKQPALLVKETIESMLFPQLPDREELETGFYCLGFAARTGEDESFYFEHGGWNEGFVALLRFYKNIGKGAVIMLNSNEGDPLLKEIMQAIALEYQWPEVLPKEKKIIELADTTAYTGMYITETGLQFDVTSNNGRITIQLAQQSPLSFFPLSELEFFAVAINTTVKFEKDATGNIQALIVNQSGKQIRAERQI